MYAQGVLLVIFRGAHSVDIYIFAVSGGLASRNVHGDSRLYSGRPQLLCLYNCSEFKLIPVTGIGAMAGTISAHIFLPTPALTIGTYFAHVMSNNVLSDGMR